MNEIPRIAAQQDMLKRIRGEFLEMPGLRLKHEQAQRLWGLDAKTCTELLEMLVEARFLFRSAGGMYGRTSDGASHIPLPMAKAGLAPRPSSRAGRTTTAA